MDIDNQDTPLEQSNTANNSNTNNSSNSASVAAATAVTTCNALLPLNQKQQEILNHILDMRKRRSPVFMSPEQLATVARELARLNDEQWDAVTHPAQHIRLIAGMLAQRNGRVCCMAIGTAENWPVLLNVQPARHVQVRKPTAGKARSDFALRSSSRWPWPAIAL